MDEQELEMQIQRCMELLNLKSKRELTTAEKIELQDLLDTLAPTGY